MAEWNKTALICLLFASGRLQNPAVASHIQCMVSDSQPCAGDALLQTLAQLMSQKSHIVSRYHAKQKHIIINGYMAALVNRWSCLLSMHYSPWACTFLDLRYAFGLWGAVTHVFNIPSCHLNFWESETWSSSKNIGLRHFEDQLLLKQNNCKFYM